MSNFRQRPDMYVVFPKTQLAHYTDNTMPRRDWSKYDMPTCMRLIDAKLARMERDVEEGRKILNRAGRQPATAS